MTKNRRPSRLLSWISMWTRRSSNNTTDHNNNNDIPPALVHHHPTANTVTSTPGNSPSSFISTVEPIDVPAKNRPSITVSVAGTIDDSIYTSSSIRSSSYATSSLHRPSAMSDILKGNEDPVLTRFGQSFPEKQTSLTLPPQQHRPSSVFSLPPFKTCANTNEHRLARMSMDTLEPALSPTPAIAQRRQQQHKQHQRHQQYPQYRSNVWPRTDRMVVRQELLRLALDGLYSSPVLLNDPSKNIKVLHIGCGSGAWCIDMAKRFKHALVLGIDERDALDRHSNMPTNFRFMCAQEDILADLKRLPDDQFDFIYGRFLLFSFRPDQYRDIVQECWRLCKPSGYMEMMELDMQIYGNPQIGPMTRIMNAQVVYLMERRSLDPYFAQHLQDIFFFHQLVEQMQQQHGDAYHASHTSLPLGVWGGRIGVMFRDDIHDLIEMIHMHGQQSLQSTISSEDDSNDDDDDDGNDDDDNGEDDNDDDRRYNDPYNPWTDQKLATTLEQVDEEFELRWAYMNLHHVYAQKL